MRPAVGSGGAEPAPSPLRRLPPSLEGLERPAHLGDLSRRHGLAGLVRSGIFSSHRSARSPVESGSPAPVLAPPPAPPRPVTLQLAAAAEARRSGQRRLQEDEALALELEETTSNPLAQPPFEVEREAEPSKRGRLSTGGDWLEDNLRSSLSTNWWAGSPRDSFFAGKENTYRPDKELPTAELQEAAIDLMRRAHGACFDSIDIDGAGYLTAEELEVALVQMGHNRTRSDLQALCARYAEQNGPRQIPGVVYRDQFLLLCDEILSHTDTGTFTADDWCPLDLGCFALDCIKWGHRDVAMSSGEILIRGFSGPCGNPAFSTCLNQSIEVAKAKWIHVETGVTSFDRVRTYCIESLLIFIGLSFLRVCLDIGSAKLTQLPPTMGLVWVGVRGSMLMLRRRATAMIFSIGQPCGRRLGTKGSFPVQRGEGEACVNSFLAAKGVIVGAKTNPVRIFSRVQVSLLCKRERHTLLLGENYYKISKEPSLLRAGTDCAAWRYEYMAGHLADVVWVHTSRWGRSCSRLSRGLAKGIIGSFVIALILSVAAGPDCVDHALCDDPVFANAVPPDALYSGVCAPECFASNCSAIPCAGLGSTCPSALDGNCDEPFTCPAGTDSQDCANGTTLMVSCPYANDGHCDEGTGGVCIVGTDIDDCGSSGLDSRSRILENYRDYLESTYQGRKYHTWMEVVVGVAAAVAADGDGASVEASCVRTTVIEKCSGCGNTNNSGHFAACKPGAVGWPTRQQVCIDISSQGGIDGSPWCDPERGLVEKQLQPCACMDLFEYIAPDWPTFYIWLAVFTALSSAINIGIWYAYTPAWCEFGYAGMSILHGSFVKHPAIFYIPRSPLERREIAHTIIEKKLDRAPSTNIIKSWTYVPFFRHLLFGFSETMVIRDDHVTLTTKGQLPRCVAACLCGPQADCDEFYMLLRDVSFVEVGSRLNPIFHSLALISLYVSIGVFFMSYTPGLFLWLEQRDGWTKAEVRSLRLYICLGALVLYLLLEVIAGAFRLGYIMLQVSPGGSERGMRNMAGGTSPFYIRLPLGHPDTSEDRYKEVIRLIRSAITSSRVKKQGEKRAISRFRAAVRKVMAMLMFGASVDQLRWNVRAIADSPESSVSGGRASTSLVGVSTVIKRHELDELAVDQGLAANKKSRGLKGAINAIKTNIKTEMTLGRLFTTVGSKSTKGKQDDGTMKIFSEIDRDGSGTVSFQEFSKWLTHWAESAVGMDASGSGVRGTVSSDLHLDCHDAFSAIDQNGDMELDLAEFRTFMASGVVGLFKAAGLWDAMKFANLFDREAIHATFDRFVEEGEDTMDTAHVMVAFHDLNLYPTGTEVDALLHVFDDDHSGTLDKYEFTNLMLDYIQKRDIQNEFSEANWCPLNLFALDLDFIPWGRQHTSLTNGEIISRGHAGVGGLGATSHTSYSSIEMSKTRWLHAEGNPAPLWKLNMYLAEALLLYTMLDHWWTFINEDKHGFLVKHRFLITRTLSTIWLGLRIATFFARKRGIVNTYSWGQPTSTRGKRPKGEFPIPIDELDEVCNSFLEIKGIDLKRAAKGLDTFRTKLPGWGCLPLSWVKWRGMHTAFFGDRHFKLEKVSGGGGSRMSRRFTRVAFMVGLTEDIKWVHVHKQGKSITRLLRGLLTAALGSAAVVLPFVLALNKTHSKCRHELDLVWNDELTTPWTAASARTQAPKSTQQLRWCAAFPSDPAQKPGRPCVCPPTTMCNEWLDPVTRESDYTRWCNAFEGSSKASFTGSQFQPCECITFFEHHLPDPAWFVTGWVVCFIPLVWGIGSLWMWYTPVTGELGIRGLDLENHGDHYGKFRISLKYILEHVFLRPYAGEVIRKIEKLKKIAISRQRLQEGGASDFSSEAFDDVGQEFQKTLEELTSVEDLAGALFGVLDAKNNGFIDAAQLCANAGLDAATANIQHNLLRFNTDWIDEVHLTMLDKLQEDEILAGDADDDAASDAPAERWIGEDNQRSFRMVGDDFDTPSDAGKTNDHSNELSRVRRLIDANSELRQMRTRGLMIDEHELRTQLGLSAEQAARYMRQEKIVELEREIDSLDKSQLEFEMQHGRVNERIEASRNVLVERVAELREAIAALSSTRNISRFNYISLFVALTQERQSGASSHLTRSRVAMVILQRKMQRPIRHELLRHWEYRPKLGYMLYSKSQQLLLHQDYVSLRLTSGMPSCLNKCCNLALTQSDYVILLSDITFIETGWSALTGLVTGSIVALFGGLVATGLFLALLRARAELSGQRGSAQNKDELFDVGLYGVLLSCLPAIVVLVLHCRDRLRRPYIHLGCLPGGGENGRANSLGGNSPFWLTLKKGTKLEDAHILADWIRGAAVLSRQNDILFQRDMELKAELRQRNLVEASPGALSVAALHRAGMTGYYNAANADEEASTKQSTSEVLRDHFVAEGEAQASVALAGQGFSWLEFLEHSAILGALAYFMGSEISEYLGLGAFPLLNYK